MPKKRHAQRPVPQPAAERTRPPAGEPVLPPREPTPGVTVAGAGLVLPRRVARRHPVPQAPVPQAPAEAPAWEPAPEVAAEPQAPEPTRWEPVAPIATGSPAREPEPRVEPEPPAWEAPSPSAAPIPAPETVLHEPEPAYEPEPAPEPEAVPEEEPKRGLFSRIFPLRDAEPEPAASEPSPEPSFAEALGREPIDPELIAFLEEREDTGAVEAPVSSGVAGEPVDEVLERDRETVMPTRSEETPETTAPFAFVTPARATGGYAAPTPAEEAPTDQAQAPAELAGAPADEARAGVSEWGDRVTEFGAPTLEPHGTAPVKDKPQDWLASRDEPATVPLAAWIAPSVDEAEVSDRAPLAPELPLPAAEERPDEDWWPEEPFAESSTRLGVEEDWWSQTRSAPDRTAVAEHEQPTLTPLSEGAPPARLTPEVSSWRSTSTAGAPDLIPIEDAPAALTRAWDSGEPALELFEELGPPAAPRAVPSRRRGARPAPKKTQVARPRAKGRSWWPIVLTILAVLIVLFVLIAAGARLGSAALWNAILPSEKAITAPDEYSYVLPSWPVFGAAPAIAETAPPGASLASTASADATAPAVLDPVLEAALPYPDPPSVQPVVIRRLKPRHRYVAITLDDGIPFDTRLMDLFARYDARATTFVVGQFASTRPELIDRLNERGFEIANHSWDHKDLTKLSDKELRSELSRTQAAISSVTGNQAPYMRPPGGKYDDRVVDTAASMGYRVVMWNRSLADTSESATPERLYRNAMDGLQAGDIILGHWGRPDTYAAMAMILPELKRRGFRAVTVSELIEDSGGVGALQ